ncbi:MAG: hypothetical protein IIB07_09250 [Bacteroidetes bacterium]|nr:hypothetical protein [Bacteroidota bacterium]
MRYIIIFIFLGSTLVYSQACCSAGSPLLSSIEVSSLQKGVLRFGFTYEFNYLNDVFTQTTNINDNTRRRIVHSVLFETNYGITSNLSVSSLFTFINQRRIIFSSLATQNKISTLGIGDAVVLVKYNFMPLSILNKNEFSIGAGVKIPFGESTLKNQGILLPADLQPGSGSWDFLLSAYGSKSFFPSLPLNIFGNASFRINGINNRFGDKFEGYSFGNEIIATLGAGYRTNSIWDFSLMFRYRNSQPDEFAQNEIANTGGNWLYIVPGINANLNNQITVRVSGSVPLYRDLTGTQLTTTYTTNFTIFYTLNNL